MENIAHSLAGVCIARAGFTEKIEPKTAFWTGIIAANFPDIDILSYPILGQEHYLLHHRGITHSLLALVLVPPLIAWLARRFTGAGSLLQLWLLAFLAFASHLAMDLSTTWGTMLLLPFSDTRFAMHWLFIVDLMVWVILSFPLWAHRFVPISKIRLNQVALLCLGAYIAFCGICHDMALSKVADAAVAQGIESTEIQAYPAALLPVVWNGVAGDRNSWHQGGIQLLGGNKKPLTRTVARNLDQEAARAAVELPLGKRFVNWWARAPYAEVRCVGDKRWVILGDLRLEHPWLKGVGFKLAFEMERDTKTSNWKEKSHRWVTWFVGEALPEAHCPSLHRSADP